MITVNNIPQVVRVVTIMNSFLCSISRLMFVFVLNCLLMRALCFQALLAMDSYWFSKLSMVEKGEYNMN